MNKPQALRWRVALTWREPGCCQRAPWPGTARRPSVRSPASPHSQPIPASALCSVQRQRWAVRARKLIYLQGKKQL